MNIQNFERAKELIKLRKDFIEAIEFLTQHHESIRLKLYSLSTQNDDFQSDSFPAFPSIAQTLPDIACKLALESLKNELRIIEKEIESL